MVGSARINGVELAYELAGTGPRLVWCHGLASCRDGDRDVIDAFAEHFTVLSYDARGHGRSAPVYDVGALTYPHLADDLIGMLAHVGWDGAILAGASMGAATIGRVACVRPGLVHAVVAIRPGAAGPDGAAPPWLQMLFAGGAHAIRSGGIDGAIRFLMTIPPARAELEADPSRLEQLRRDWTRHDPLSIAAALEGIPRTVAVGGDLHLRMISCPTLVVPGNDLIHPVDAGREVAAQVPGARCLEPFAGLSRAAEVARLVDEVRAFVGASIKLR